VGDLGGGDLGVIWWGIWGGFGGDLGGDLGSILNVNLKTIYKLKKNALIPERL
jgi:hypothetical protein